MNILQLFKKSSINSKNAAITAAYKLDKERLAIQRKQLQAVVAELTKFYRSYTMCVYTATYDPIVVKEVIEELRAKGWVIKEFNARFEIE